MIFFYQKIKGGGGVLADILKPGVSEETDQILFVNWVHRAYPELWPWLHHSPNGGKRDKRTASRFKLMGVRSGFPDLVLIWAAPGWNGGPSGLAIEMKVGRCRASKSQKEWIEHLRRQGWAAEVATLAQAKVIFKNYVNGDY